MLSYSSTILLICMPLLLLVYQELFPRLLRS
uniref:Thiol:disulfide interchange protein dsbD n=1 Tax=Rhizophora mucronata TaxID=61149 RepID=A0A2P2KLY7_RHIMU